jgi:hypothetical protein
MVRMVEMQTNILVRKSERKTPVGIPWHELHWILRYTLTFTSIT